MRLRVGRAELLQTAQLRGSLQRHVVAGAAKTHSQMHPSSGLGQVGGSWRGDWGKPGFVTAVMEN